VRVLFSLLDAAVGGGQRVALEVARRLTADEDRIGLFVPDEGPASDDFRGIGAEVYHVELQTLRRTRGVGPATEIAGEFDLLYSHTSVPGEILGARVARQAHIPHVVHRHTEPHFSPRLSTRLGQQWLYRRSLHATPFIAVAPHIATALERLGIERASITVITNGIDVEETRQRGRRPIARGDGVVVGLLGRLDPRQKGQDLFLEAVRLLNDSRAQYVIGANSGPFHDQEAAIRQLAASTGVEIEEPGGAGVEFLASLDIVVIPSRYEGSPLTLFEAMALGKPIIASRIPGIAEVLQPHGAGVLVPPRDAEALADAITSLVADPARRKALGRTALDVVRGEHDISSLLARITRLLHATVGSKRSVAGHSRDGRASGVGD
jgi:glycosyltransferase involved in cell wall biosynthesis